MNSSLHFDKSGSTSSLPQIIKRPTGINRFRKASINVISVNRLQTIMKPTKKPGATTNKPSGLISFGKNDFGQLGTGDKTDHVQPNAAHFFDDKEVLHVACGQYHTIFTVIDHWNFDEDSMTWEVFSRVYGCGKGNWGQYGNGAHLSTELPHYAMSPVEIPLFAEKRVTQVACGLDFTLFVVDEQLWSCGNNRYGQLGSKERAHSEPVLSDFFKSRKVMTIACGDMHSIVVANRGSEVFATGRNKWGQLGLGNTIDQTKFIPVPLFDSRSKMNAKKGKEVLIHCTHHCTHTLYSHTVLTHCTHSHIPHIIHPTPLQRIRLDSWWRSHVGRSAPFAS
jgi:alpha-tubulin suppressor-like RCC1 family protein